MMRHVERIYVGPAAGATRKMPKKKALRKVYSLLCLQDCNACCAAHKPAADQSEEGPKVLVKVRSNTDARSQPGTGFCFGIRRREKQQDKSRHVTAQRDGKQHATRSFSLPATCVPTRRERWQLIRLGHCLHSAPAEAVWRVIFFVDMPSPTAAFHVSKIDLEECLKITIAPEDGLCIVCSYVDAGR